MNNEKLDKLRAASAGENSYLCSMGDLCQMPSVSCHRAAWVLVTENSFDQKSMELHHSEHS